MVKTYDIAVIGATAAGWAAGSALAHKRRDVVVIECPCAHSESSLGDWVPKSFFATRQLPRSLAAAAKAVPFRAVCYHNTDLSQEAQHSSRSTAGYLLRAGGLVRALQAAARKAGAKLRRFAEQPVVQLEEDAVRILGDSEVVARALLICQSRPAEVLTNLALPIRTVPRASCTAAGLDVPAGDRATARRLGKALHVIQSSEPTELGLFFLVGDTLHLRVVSTSAASGNRAAELSEMISRLQSAGLLPAGLSLARARGAVWTPPMAEALEMESHVAKRCILAGTAGGFVEPITAHTLTPTVRSALIAADVIAEALAGEDVQDDLMRFKSLWRTSLADYLRPPSTSLRLLLPLLFANRRLVDRFTRALLYGENI
jgi:flavin-dependent dehydrogenase